MKSVLAFIAALALAGCDDNAKVILKKEEQVAQQYCSSDLSIAERALREWKTTLSAQELRAKVKKLDVDFMLAITSARLAGISEQKGDVAGFQLHRREAESYLNRSKARRGNPPVQLSDEDIRRIVRQADSELTVSWKHQ